MIFLLARAHLGRIKLKLRVEIKYLWGTHTRVNLVVHGGRYYNFCAKIKHVGQELQYTGPR